MDASLVSAPTSISRNSCSDSMRQRLCYFALLVLPLCAYGPLVLAEFGTPADFVRLGAGEAVADGATRGIVNNALVDISFHWINSVPLLSLARGLGLLLLVLCGVALWQILERGGWGEIEAAALSLGVLLLPSAQVVVGWATLWPVALAALLAIAGFAAAESELEMGGTRRGIGLLGGALLYFGAAMCEFSSALMGLIPLAALTLSRPAKVRAELNRWFGAHLAVALSGLVAACVLERWLMHGAGVPDRTELIARAGEMMRLVLPAGLSGFCASQGVGLSIMQGGMAVVLVALVVLLVRRDQKRSGEISTPWRLALAVPAVVIVLAVFAAPVWCSGYQIVWALGSLLLVGVIGGVRGAGELPAKPGVLQYATWLLVVLAGLAAAHVQTRVWLSEPLGSEWERLRAGVYRAKFVGDTAVHLVLPAPDARAIREGVFSPRVAESAHVAEQMFNVALRERFPAGLPKGAKVRVERIQTRPAENAGVVFDLR